MSSKPPRMGWRHVILSTHRAWAVGDERGWRSRDHRIHSSGDYKNPPPKEEHEGLREYHKRRVTGAAVIIPLVLRRTITLAAVKHLVKKGIRVLAVGTSNKHLHLQLLLPDDKQQMKKIAGAVKQAASRAVTEQMPGQVFAEGGKFKPIDTKPHQQKVFQYILDHREEGAYVWTYRDERPE